MNPEQEYREGLRRILEGDSRYPEAAYAFVRAGVTFTTEKLKANNPERTERHITGRQLLDGLRELAIEQFGPLAFDVLQEWRIRRTEDFGNIVFNLVNASLLGASDEDKPEDFAEGYSFNEAFLKPFVELGTVPETMPKIDET